MVKPDNSCATKTGHFYLLLTGISRYFQSMAVSRVNFFIFHLFNRLFVNYCVSDSSLISTVPDESMFICGFGLLGFGAICNIRSMSF